jgi:hypothetical protein
MKTITTKILAIVLCSGLLAAAGAAEAHSNGRGHPPAHSGAHHKHHTHFKHSAHGKPHRAVKERVIVHHAPPRYREHHVVHHYYPAYPYAYDAPAVVISIPPIIIPVR